MLLRWPTIAHKLSGIVPWSEDIRHFEFCLNSKGLYRHADVIPNEPQQFEKECNSTERPKQNLKCAASSRRHNPSSGGLKIDRGRHLPILDCHGFQCDPHQKVEICCWN
jgi:hypothetical protein